MKRFTSNILFFIIILMSFSDCGLFYKGVPKAGEFCYVLAKPPECLYVDFESKKLIWNNVEYVLEEKLRMDYFFKSNDELYELTVSTVNRVELKNLTTANFNQFYMRKKDKFVEMQTPDAKHE
ncbi:hypothetical protein EHQ68_18030 [Leptospira congkakensis]|uniref:Lipoprotein n=1 Tax=Leptospira congkakensis TaxID=2484932 RepID=A0A4Z1A964_9LEPT|nr:hypothetical protein [Leptospira congkakensis]TGL85204.1 hypothetical protein EHQ68_18030 [Leptospira congkakensis]TGL92914.1 hypothetical protein EHQ69_07645 [Leptospira congkakensis]TGL96101.1 hypothetical protein EHQ70_10720 [Leptospira congkakensis]